MFYIKGNLKALHSVEYCNGVLCMSVLIILSPYFAFQTLAYETVIEFFPFCDDDSGMVSNFKNIEYLLFSDFTQKIFSLSKCVFPFVRFSQHWL